MKNKNKNQYGSFVTKKPWYFNRKQLVVGGISLAVLVLSVGVIFRLYKSDKQQVIFEIPQAVASEIPGWWYADHFGRAVCETEDCKPDADPDSDKLTNKQEFFYHTNPQDAHTVDDPLNDGELVAAGFDPSRSGRKTFEEIMSPDNILVESLLVDEDIKDIVKESQDISKVFIPLVGESELKVTRGENTETYKNYFADLKNTINRHFKESEHDRVNLILKNGTRGELEEIKNQALLLSFELRRISVPHRMLTYHQHVIAFYQLLGQVLQTEPSSLDLSSKESDIWFENIQALFAVSQKLDLEQQRLNLSVQVKP